jgi:DNA (cytosine-5)-methyltransferase 1
METRPRLLDLFCGAGGAGMGYFRAGFDVTGVDIKPQPRYPFAFIQGDALDYCREHAHEYDAIHASPPCQAFTTLRVMHNAREHGDLLTPTRTLLASLGLPHVIENVPGAPMPSAVCLCGTAFDLGATVYDGWRELRRHRWFESNSTLFAAPCRHRGATIGIYGDHARDRRRKPGTHRGLDFPNADKLALGRAAMGIDWMNWRELSQAIPPAYTTFIGAQVLAHIALAAA